MYRCSPEGKLLYANTAWHELTGYPLSEADKYTIDWGSYINESYFATIQALWQAFVESDEQSMDAELAWTNGRFCELSPYSIQE